MGEILQFPQKCRGLESARDILGQDFISPEEIMFSKETLYTNDQLARLNATLPLPAVLRWCRDNGYMLVAGPPQPMSFLEICSLDKEYHGRKDGGWYDNQPFANNDKVESDWLMLRKKPVPCSTAKKWLDQQALLFELEFTPNAAELVWGVKIYKEVRNIFLFPDVYVRTSSRAPNGERVYLGCHEQTHGLFVNWGPDEEADLQIGLSARKS